MENRQSTLVHGHVDRRQGRALYRQTVGVVAAAGFCLMIANVYASSVATFGFVAALTSTAIYLTVSAIIVSRILAFHPHSVFGWPNTVTLARTVLAALIAGYAAEVSHWTLQPSSHLAWTFAGMAVLAVSLDGLDGLLARRVGPRSAFGARFDMESDALVILILSVLAFVLDKTGPWVVLIGLSRYVFIGAAYLWPWLSRPMPPSLRRKGVCALLGILLSGLVMPVVDGTFAVIIAASALGLNLMSFAIDIVWLSRNRAGTDVQSVP
ncbi:CDP-alcohol phosphatidyltransferase family protein [Pararhizobium haloflavum]|uniref:CDP-alcohol phosphatidyltransferase family protein n=1 Tax=Pararhizobium haloflavum TaxID=2037914 RepID=UPI000C176B00|nr:CDP-alcohol phosphatidyltransferase family protein [Pararhizobium haloflavum]